MSRPLGITVIAIILLISGILNVFLGLVALDILRFDLGALASGAEANGAALIVGGVLTLIVATGMFATAGWAWWLTVVVMIVRIAVDVWAIITHGLTSTIGYAAIVNLVISAVILWYFNRASVKAAFGR